MVNVNIPKGKFIIAVSGGVDSMVLLDIARSTPGVNLIVAHCNHGIRSDAHLDEALVASYANKYKLPFASTRRFLGLNTDEATAREARYNFLKQCSKKFKANGILTAHHQDDMLETAIINIIRGTGWRGLAPFMYNNHIRPLIQVTKNELISYARSHNIEWREDSTNSDQHYLRNYVRHTFIPILEQKSDIWRETFLRYIRNQQLLGRQIDTETLQLNDLALSRYFIVMLPDNVACELLQSIMRRITGKSVTSSSIETILLFTKTAKPHKIMPINRHWQCRVTLRNLIVEPRPDVIR